MLDLRPIATRLAALDPNPTCYQHTRCVHSDERFWVDCLACQREAQAYQDSVALFTEVERLTAAIREQVDAWPSCLDNAAWHDLGDTSTGAHAMVEMLRAAIGDPDAV